MRTRTLTTLAAGLAVLAASAGAAGAASSDTIRGSVVVAAPAEACINIALDGILFGGTGGLGFTPDTGDGADNVTSTSSGAVVENCSTADQTFEAHATVATGTQGASWSPYDPTPSPGNNVCADGLDMYRLAVTVTDTEPDSGTWLTTTDGPVNGADTNDPVLAGTTRTVDHTLTMPCEGSTGVDGEEVSFDIVYTAVLAP